MSTFFFQLGIWERDSLEGMLLVQPSGGPRVFGWLLAHVRDLRHSAYLAKPWNCPWPSLYTNFPGRRGEEGHGESHSGTCWISREHLYTHNWYFQLNKIHIQQIPTLCIISNAASEWGCIFITSLPISYFPFLTFTVTSYMPSCLMLSYLEPFGNMIHHFSNFSRLPLLVSRLQRELFSLILLNCPPLLTPSVISKIWRFKEKTKMKKKQCNWKAA